MNITVGRIVLYTLSETDAEQINAQHAGRASAGDTLPAIVVRVADDTVNLQVFLDGNSTFWATTIHEDINASKVVAGLAPEYTPGAWRWPARG